MKIMPLIIIIVECGIELIPNEIKSHSAIRKNLTAQNLSSQLLDNALHHSAMKNLKDSGKRGRPDITHLCLLNALGSSLYKSGNLRIYMHTINNKIFEFNPEIRIARNYNRFKGLMTKLLIDDKIEVNDKQLISLFTGNIQDLINMVRDPKIILFSSKGKLVKHYPDLFPEEMTKNTIAIIGGFQKNTYSDELLNLSENLISISKYSLDAWVVVSKVINLYEMRHMIF
jgi:rRNA small subunit pseudouridine methyltransferase Nep1